MRFGRDRFAAAPFASSPVSYAVASRFSELLADPDIERVFLFQASPYDPDAAAVVTSRFSANSDAPVFGGYSWPARLENVVNMSNDLFAGGAGDLLAGLGSYPSFGTISIQIGDGEHDELTRYNWDGREIQVLMGAADFAFADFSPILRATASDGAWDEEVFTLSMRDFSARLNKPIQAAQYTGAGGLEGSDDIKNRGKPLAFGPPRNVSPVLIDAAFNVYQFHDGEAFAVPAVYDAGAMLTPATNLPSVYDWIPVPGEYITDLAAGVLRLGAQPSGTITADVQGATDGGALVTTAADLVKFIAINYGGFSVSDLDLSGFAAVNNANPAPIALFINDEATTISAVLSKIMGSVGGFWTFTFDGLLTVGIVKIGSPAFTLTQDSIESITRRDGPLPVWRRRLGYAKCWTVQTANDIAAGASDGQRAFCSSEYRYAADSDAGIASRRLLAVDSTVDTLLVESADAQAETERQLALLGPDRDFYTVTDKRLQYRARIGQTIRVNHPRFQLPGEFVVLGITEDETNKQTTFRLWG